MYINHDPDIDKAIEKLGLDFPRLNWDFSPESGGSYLVSHWLGDESEEVMVNVFLPLQKRKDNFKTAGFFGIIVYNIDRGT